MHARNLLSALVISGLVFAGSGQVMAGQDGQITEEDVIHAQQVWGEAIVAIGEAYTSQEDYEALAEEVIDRLYGYDEGSVLFKPTKAAEEQFRSSKEEALSYFVTGSVPEDHGFAIQPWSDVRFENDGIILDEDSALAMGNYYFTDANSGDEVKVEFTFGYFQDEDGDLRIRLHHSSLPYQPQH
ncbi:phosphoribosyl-AMP cyclohydrolase [Halomonas sp. A29]|uniref:phosphoribosyl-AMP cyclohydrolase n=1 Tax=Halomonas sp. A29 TaxID=3102786 RepID=UPI00398A8DEC